MLLKIYLTAVLLYVILHYAHVVKHQSRGLQSTARGQDPSLRAVLSGPQGGEVCSLSSVNLHIWFASTYAVLQSL